MCLPDRRFFPGTSIGILATTSPDSILVMVCHTDISVSPYMWYTLTPVPRRVTSLRLAASQHLSPPTASTLEARSEYTRTKRYHGTEESCMNKLFCNIYLKAFIKKQYGILHNRS